MKEFTKQTSPSWESLKMDRNYMILLIRKDLLTVEGIKTKFLDWDEKSNSTVLL